jgi:hypothetical protein
LALKWQKSDFQDGHLEATKQVESRKIKKAVGVLPQGIFTPSFIEIALAVTKRCLLTDDDGRQVIAIAHQKGELKRCEPYILCI